MCSTDTSFDHKEIFANGPSRGGHQDMIRQPRGLGQGQGPCPYGQELWGPQSLAMVNGKLACYAVNLSPALLHLGFDAEPAEGAWETLEPEKPLEPQPEPGRGCRELGVCHPPGTGCPGTCYTRAVPTHASHLRSIP